MIGVYKLTNKINNCVYIGSSSHIEDREEYHFRLGKNWKPKVTIKKNKISQLYKEIHDFGKENFPFEIIEELDKVRDLKDREQYWCDFYISHGYDVYNIDKKIKEPGRGINASQAKLNQEQLQEIIALLKENILSDREIAKKYNICFNAISEINHGYSYHQDDLSYPIRVFKQKGHSRAFTEEEVRAYRKEYEENGHQAKEIYNRDNLSERVHYTTFWNMCRKRTYTDIE